MFKRSVKAVLIAFLIVILLIPAYLSFVSSSTGNIKIDTTGTSVSGQVYQAGDTINLYLGNVAWSGDSFGLFLSQDASSQLASGLLYSPSFSVYAVADPTRITNYTQDSGVWLVGNNWINGSLPLTVALGNYYIKAIDLVGSSVAVTDTYITVTPIIYNSTLSISPSSGPGGIPITFTGANYPINQNIAITYFDPAFGTWNYLATATSNASGVIQVNSQVPDLRQALGSSDYPETYTALSYRSEINGIVYGSATYNEYQRGLKTVANTTASGLFGNGTNLASNVRVIAGDLLALSGKWFHPGIIYVRWDSYNVVGTVTSNEWAAANIIGSTATNATGSFNLSVVIPNAAAGEHYVAVEDSQGARVIVKIFVTIASLQITPASGPGGATTQFTGSNYPPSSQIDVYYLDPNFGSWNYWTTTPSDTNGKISLSVEIPDLKQSSYQGEYNNYTNTLSFKTQLGNVSLSFGDYIEFARGLQQVGDHVAYGLIGNGTDLTSSVRVKPGDNLFVFGKYFHPGVVYVKFDGMTVVGTVTGDQWRNTAMVLGLTSASQTGSFQMVVTIPAADSGTHYLAVEDSQTIFITQIYVSNPTNATPTPSPTASPAPIPTPSLPPFPTSTPIPSPTSTPTAAPTASPIPTPTVSPTTPPTSNPTPIKTPSPTPTSTPIPTLPTPTFELTGKSTKSASISEVEINGLLQLNGTSVAGVPIQLSISKTGGQDWESLTMVSTGSDGSFSALWQPSATGNYLIKAFLEKTTTMNEATKVVNFALANQENSVFSLTSNSTITQFNFNPDGKELSFIASGPSGTKGYVDLYIPKDILDDASQLKAYVDGNQVSFSSQSQSESWLIQFDYSHSQHKITLTIEETTAVNNDAVSQWVIYVAPVAVFAAIAAVAFALKKRNKIAR